MVLLSGSVRDSDLGNYDSTEHKIGLRPEYASERQKAETVIHEALHAIWHIYGVRQKDSEERVVGAFSVGLSSLLRDNKEVIEWLLRALS